MIPSAKMPSSSAPTVLAVSEVFPLLPQPEPTYEDDPAMEAGVQILVSKGDKGSTWNTYIKHEYPDGRVTDELFHVSRYKGHKPKIKRNQALWDPAFDIAPTDENGETMAVETYVNEAGETVIGYRRESESTEPSDTSEVGPGASALEPLTKRNNSGNNGPGNTEAESAQTGPVHSGGGYDDEEEAPGGIPLVPVIPAL